jgi:competence protein ComGC
MTKLNKKGFMLTETLIVSTMLIGVLLILYVQFKNVTRSFSESFTYNTIDSSYNLYNAKLYIEKSNYSLIAEKLKSTTYVDLTDCSSMYFSNTTYCQSLFTKLGIKKIIMTNENIYSLIQNNDFDEDFALFLKSVKYQSTDGYRLVASFTDGTFSSIKILNDQKFDYALSNSCNASKEVTYRISHIGVVNPLYTEGQTIAEDTIGKSTCGTTIVILNSAIKNNSCYYAIKTSPTDTLNLTFNDSANTATIYYSKYTANLTINHYKYGTTTAISDPTIVNSTCGNEILVEQYKKNIAGFNYFNTDQEKVTMGSTNTTINLYYKEV